MFILLANNYYGIATDDAVNEPIQLQASTLSGVVTVDSFCILFSYWIGSIGVWSEGV